MKCISTILTSCPKNVSSELPNKVHMVILQIATKVWSTSCRMGGLGLRKGDDGVQRKESSFR